MTEKINVVGKKAPRIRDTGRVAERISPKEFASKLNALPVGERRNGDLDPVSLAELGRALLQRLRSTGGRPALVDTTKSCKIPLSAEDVEVMEQVIQVMEQTTGTRPSLGQIGSVILRLHLQALSKLLGQRIQNEATTDSKYPTKTNPLLNDIRQLIKEELEPIRKDIDRLKETGNKV